MRQVGDRIAPPVGAPTARALSEVAPHLHLADALAAVKTTGVVRGVYRFRNHAEANAHAEAALALGMAANIRAREPVR